MTGHLNRLSALTKSSGNDSSFVAALTPSRRRLLQAVCLAPAALLLGAFLLGPLLWAAGSSFTDMALTGAAARNQEWVGLDNYVQLFDDPDFGESLLVTVVFVLLSGIIGQNVLGLCVAVWMRHGYPALGAVARLALVIAWILPEIVAAFAAIAFFRADGTLNWILGLGGMAQPNWLFDSALAVVIAANIWRGTAFSMMVYRAALDGVPASLVEAAALDGAGPLRRLAYVTLPLIRGSIVSNLMLTTLQTFSVFTLIFVMTGGGPSRQTMTLPVMAYREAFEFGNIGYGIAVSVVVVVLAAVFSAAYLKLLAVRQPEMSA